MWLSALSVWSQREIRLGVGGRGDWEDGFLSAGSSAYQPKNPVAGCWIMHMKGAKFSRAI